MTTLGKNRRLQSMDEVFEKFKEWKTMVEKRTGKHVKTLKTDNGLELMHHLMSFVRKKVVRHCIAQYTKQNRAAERMNQTLLQCARCMQLSTCLPKHFSAKVVNTTCYLVNRSPLTAIDFKTLQEVWSDSPSDYPGLRIFGCPAYAHVNDGKL